MKKLLFLGILVGMATSAFALPGAPGAPNYNGDGAVGNYDFSTPFILEDGGPTKVELPSHNGAETWGRVNRFIKEGSGRTDEATMGVSITIHRPVRIYAEVASVEFEGVKGDRVAFGDINWLVTGSKNVDVTFKFDGYALEMLTRADVIERGNGPGTGDVKFVTDANTDLVYNLALDEDKTNAILEMDLYFKLNKNNPGTYTGTVTAMAEYK